MFVVCFEEDECGWYCAALFAVEIIYLDVLIDVGEL